MGQLTIGLLTDKLTGTLIKAQTACNSIALEFENTDDKLIGCSLLYDLAGLPVIQRFHAAFGFYGGFTSTVRTDGFRIVLCSGQFCCLAAGGAYSLNRFAAILFVNQQIRRHCVAPRPLFQTVRDNRNTAHTLPHFALLLFLAFCPSLVLYGILRLLQCVKSCPVGISEIAGDTLLVR